MIVFLFYASFWVIPRLLNFEGQRFGTHYLFHLHRRVGMKNDWGWEFWGIYKGKSSLSSELRLFSSQTFSRRNTPTFSTPSLFIPTRLWRWNRQSVPKRRPSKFRLHGITQKEAYNIQNTAKVWSQEGLYLLNIVKSSFSVWLPSLFPRIQRYWGTFRSNNSETANMRTWNFILCQIFVSSLHLKSRVEIFQHNFSLLSLHI
jgi:hypothetical protein